MEKNIRMVFRQVSGGGDLLGIGMREISGMMEMFLP